MRLNNLLKDTDDFQDSKSVERVEALLKQAADFEPDIQPVDDFVARALKRRSRFRIDPSRPIALGMTGLAGMATMMVLVMLLSKHEVMIPTIPPPMPGGTSVAEDTSGKGLQGSQNSPSNINQKRVAGQSNTPKVDSGLEERGRIQNAGFETRGSRRRETGKAVRRAPKVRWENEVVQRYDRGVMAPAYVEEQGHNGEVEYHPVMVPVATETGARPILIDGGPDATFSLTSNPEETSHK